MITKCCCCCLTAILISLIVIAAIIAAILMIGKRIEFECELFIIRINIVTDLKVLSYIRDSEKLFVG